MIVASAESSYWTHTALIQAIIGIWFAASHQPWIVGPFSNPGIAILSLTLHRIYILCFWSCALAQNMPK